MIAIAILKKYWLYLLIIALAAGWNVRQSIIHRAEINSLKHVQQQEVQGWKEKLQLTGDMRYAQGVSSVKCPPQTLNSTTIGKVKGNSGVSLDVSQVITEKKPDSTKVEVRKKRRGFLGLGRRK